MNADLVWKLGVFGCLLVALAVVVAPESDGPRQVATMLVAFGVGWLVGRALRGRAARALLGLVVLASIFTAVGALHRGANALIAGQRLLIRAAGQVIRWAGGEP